jgi:seryl-tRNA synthetase
MLDVRLIREQTEMVREGLRAKRSEDRLDEFLALDIEHRRLLSEVEGLRHRRNEVGTEIANRKRAGEDAAALIEEMRTVKTSEKAGKEELDGLNTRLEEILLWLPNIPAEDVPRGATEDDNEVVCVVGEKPEYAFSPQAHWDLGKDLDILDPEASGKLAGSGFLLLKGAGARLERALSNFMLDQHRTEHGYTEIHAPALARTHCLLGSAQLPKLESDMYRLPGDDLFLIPTGEVPLVNLHREEILPFTDLPIRLTALTPCFRREAGAAGRDTRGMIRVHQFNKVEMVAVTTPDEADGEFERMLGAAEDVLKALGLCYRVLVLCTGDMTFASRKTYDIEVWSPGVDRWLEVSSVSTCSDFQARRTKTRYRDPEGKVRHVHFLNGSGTALPRMVVAVLETFQQADGTVVVPEPLQPYLGGLEVIEPETQVGEI